MTSDRGPDPRSAARRVRMLASVISVAEARLAAAAGADLVDCKNPAEGALGALAHAEIAAIRAAIPRLIPVSATIGDLPLDPTTVLPAAEAMAATGADIVKIGLFPGPDAEGAIDALAPLAARVELVGVLLADRAPDFDLIPALARAGFSGVMLDTAGKAAGSLRTLMPSSALEDFIVAARSWGLFAGLAGALRLADVPALLALAPDVLGFRGALCARADRTAPLDPASLDAVRRAIPAARAGAAPELERS